MNPLSLDDKKLYYSIGEVAQMFDVNVSLIRFWEKEFDTIKPYKNKKGDRFFTKKDIEYFQTIYSLVKDKGYTLEGARKYLKSGIPNNTLETSDVIKQLQHIKDELIKMKEMIIKKNEEI